jgi:uncharacterized DUF497 family protein
MQRTGSTGGSTTASRSKRRPLFSSILLRSFRKDRIAEGEQRWHAIGSVLGAVLLVVHVYRLKDTDDEEENIRIIAACEANKRERRIYLHQASE